MQVLIRVNQARLLSVEEYDTGSVTRDPLAISDTNSVYNNGTRTVLGLRTVEEEAWRCIIATLVTKIEDSGLGIS